MSGAKGKGFSRRHFTVLGGVGVAASGLSLPLAFSDRFALAANHASAPLALTSLPPHQRFLQIYLRGGWDSAYATDPVVGSKLASATYHESYRSANSLLAPADVPGKSRLVVGPGLAPAVGAFTALPTAFINGIFMEVTAHELAGQYIQSGRVSLSNSRDYPALGALLGQVADAFPPHVALGYTPPLGSTAHTTPPLMAHNAASLADFLSAKTIDGLSPDVVALGLTMAQHLDEMVGALLSKRQAGDANLWNSAAAQVEGVYAIGYGPRLQASAEEKARYGVSSDWEQTWGQALMSTLKVMQADLSRVVSVSAPGVSYDTHFDHIATQLPALKSFAVALATLVADLQTNQDPAWPEYTLAETTTIVISSEFVRTPSFNINGGSDHHPSASMIVMGKGVRDNTLIGATDSQAMPLGWDNSSGSAVAGADHLLPDHVIASLARMLGAGEAANEISEVNIDALAV